ncbi:response regulator [Hahella sp. HN01]|uniref:response regulator n=1 Tax=Hahella sp. HN01 TaxID=2847262 RepID=UPI001C1EF7B9|nr:response regulator [Hahella sp. HN01]MBU6951206.1 response regulator [Hahella sp. HN01]
MSDEKPHVMIVDDSPNDLHFLLENLKDEYAVQAATSAAKALQMAEKDPELDVVLLDVTMPEMDGYECCRRLKANPATQHIEVIFVSAHDTVEEKLAGYDAGGRDYLIKPAQPDVLRKKVRMAIQQMQQAKAGQEAQQAAMSTAMTAITVAGEQGVILEFLRRSMRVDTLADLAGLIIETLEEFDLQGTVQINLENDKVSHSSKGFVSPLESELLLKVKDQEQRLLEFNKRLLVNIPPFSLLVPKMPDDDEKKGRARDNLLLLLECAEFRRQGLENQSLIALIEGVLQDSRKALKDINEVRERQHKTAFQVLEQTLDELVIAYDSLALLESQEETLTKVVRNGLERTFKTYEEVTGLDEQLEAIIHRMEHCRGA